MRILFIENRTSVILWQKAANAMSAEGHTIHWLVQNHLYSPKAGNVHILPYPSAADLTDAPLDPSLRQIAKTDRAVLHYGVTPRHYPHYQRWIEDVMSLIEPDAVFGESTNFHELMVLASCKQKSIPYIAPLETRYPAGRMVFYREDTFEPVGGCGQTLTPEANRDLLRKIVLRDVVPAYMEAPSRTWRARAGQLKEHVRLAQGWLLGERYLTPSPTTRMRLNRIRARTKSAWDALSESRVSFDPERDRTWVLYPLQLQPESNLDVFGQPWVDQCETMVRAAAALERIGAKLVVKPNPKSKFEMTPALLRAAQRHGNIVPLAHSCAMASVFPHAPLVLSVTGTVILECIFNGKPVAVLGQHEMTLLAGVTPIGTPEQVAAVLGDVHASQASRATLEEGESTLQWLHKTSYAARLFDPISRPDLLTSESIRQLQSAFLDVLTKAVGSRATRP